MDDIGLAGGLFILVAGALSTLVFVVLPVWVAIDVYRRRDAIHYPLLFITVLLGTIPFGVGGILAIAYLVSQRHRGASNPQRSQ